MKQAILIVAYRDIDYLINIIALFNSHDYIFFIHFNKKSILSDEDIIKLKNIENIKLVSHQYTTFWGSFNHLKAILHLSTEALKYKVDYIHLISGQDFPIKSGDFIKEFLLQNTGKEFINSYTLPSTIWSDEGFGFDRLNYYHFNDYLSSNSRYQRFVLKVFFIIQKALGIERKWPSNFPKIYGGETWWTLSYSCLKYVTEFGNQNPKFFKRFKNTKVAEEIYFQTIIMNSIFKENVVDFNLRYILWKWKNGSRPAILDRDDLDTLRQSNAFFARKFILPISEELLNDIKRIII